MAGHALLKTASRTIQKLPACSFIRCAHGSAVMSPEYLHKIGKREIVGPSFNGEPNYMDRVDFPLPAVRYKEETPEIKALREKEKGDWRKLTVEEKKQLYRFSFKQTLVEIRAPTGQWKSILGCTLMFCSLSLWIYMGMKLFVYDPLPDSFSLENRQAQLQRMIDLRIGHVDGISSKWDYDKNEWKK
uniref:Cytochrome c oxidase subunit 4 n=1 Tax=Clastoptera arizonana TaxID=38151 RepID=A0A1B6D2G1_9HEMI